MGMMGGFAFGEACGGLYMGFLSGGRKAGVEEKAIDGLSASVVTWCEYTVWFWDWSVDSSLGSKL